MNNYRGPIEEVFHQQHRCAPEDEVYKLRVLLQQARDLIKDGWEYSGSHTEGMRLAAEIDKVLGK